MLNLHTKKTKLNSEGTNLNQTKTMEEKMEPGLCVKSENKSWELDQNAWIRMVMMSHFQRGQEIMARERNGFNETKSKKLIKDNPTTTKIARNSGSYFLLR